MEKQQKAKKLMVGLGDKARDIVTGFVGVVTAKVEYLNGCKQFCLQPPAGKDGKRPESVYIDWQQLERVGPGVSIAGLGTGGPSGSAPTRYAG